MKEEFAIRNERLQQIKAELKQEFFGIDECIDRIIESIKTWYIMPRVILRPIIVNLWGLTGVGKTALVRSLVDKLNMNDVFVEIQMDAINVRNYEKSICGILESSNIQPDGCGIIFLDEFQRFRTIDKDGSDVKLERFQDVWQLLSDGKFSSDYSLLSQIETQIANVEYQAQYEQDEEDEEEEEKEKKKRVKKRPFSLSPWEARAIKKVCKLTIPTKEIMVMSRVNILKLLAEYSSAGETINYNKCLIFIAGNLDEAFSPASSVEDCDTNADAFYDYVRGIGAVEIKKALTRRFKPEQISRFGNNHIVYPSLNSDAYRRIIRRECGKYIEEFENLVNIKFNIHSSVYSEIYENSVYPAQGTRPVFTSIHKIFASPLANAILWALSKDYETVDINIDMKESFVVFTHDDDKIRVPVELDIRERKAKRTDDFNALIAVHEAGHAIAHLALTHSSPLEIAIDATSFADGYVRMQVIKSESKQDLENNIAIGLGGTVAEELIFGPDNLSSGCASDINRATHVAGLYIRRLGFGKTNSMVHIEKGTHLYNENISDTNDMIEQILSDQKERCKQVIRDNKSLLILIAKILLVKKKIFEPEIIELVKPYFPDITPINKDAEVSHGYFDILSKL